MFVEYAVLYARISGQVGESFPPLMTLAVDSEIAQQATAWVNDFVTLILGTIDSTKVQKLLRRVMDAIDWHGNLVNGSTASNEALHKEEKPYYLRTNKNPKSFTEQLVRQAVGAKAIKAKLAAGRDAWRASRRRGRAGRAAHRVRESACAAAARRAQSAAGGYTAEFGSAAAAKKSHHLERVPIDMLALRPGLCGLTGMLGMHGTDTVPVLACVRIDATFHCGTMRQQLLRASPDCRGKPRYDAVWYQLEGGVANYCVGEARAIFRTAEGDKVAIVEMEPVAGEPGCPLVRRGCSRLRWHKRDNETDCAVRVVQLARVRRVIHVVPDFAELTERKGFGACPAAPDSPLAERLAMHYFLNVFFPWDV